MSLLLIGISILLILALYRRVFSRARAAIRKWADDYGYRVDSARFHAAFSADYQEAGREAEIVYRVVLSSSTGDKHVAFFLMWNLIAGPTSVVVRWDEPDQGP
jgi:hypothetical protein